MKTGFPSELFSPETTVLSLFSAAFLGENDVKHIHAAGVKKCLMVDIDMDKLVKTKKLYGYHYNACDAFDLVRRIHSCGYPFDIVITDPFTGVDMERTFAILPELLELTSKYLIIGCTKEYLNDTDEFYHRSNFKGGIYWRVICK